MSALVHFTPTSASWINLVERFFGKLTNKQLRRAAFRSTEDLEQTIKRYLAVRNEEPRPFIWTKSAEDILASMSLLSANLRLRTLADQLKEYKGDAYKGVVKDRPHR